MISSIRFCAIAMAVSLPLVSLAGQSDWARKENRNEISKLSSGDVSSATASMEAYLQARPEDPETLFGLTAAHSLAGRVNTAEDYFLRSLKAGVDLGRFAAGPRRFFEALRAGETFGDAMPGISRLIHGPMVGQVTPYSASFWVRTDRSRTVQVEVWTGDIELKSVIARSVSVVTGEADDFTAKMTVRELSADQEYRYTILVDGEPMSASWRFRTFPKDLMHRPVRVVFGGGAAYNPDFERIWKTIEYRRPEALLLLGDNVYIDDPTKAEVQQYCYYRRQSHPHFRSMSSRVPVYSIWDDHDFGTDDCWGGASVDDPVWKRDVWKVYQENWNNPSHGMGDSVPGCWYSFLLGEVEFFMLDGRYYREAPSERLDRSMLGPVQLAWLKRSIASSSARFKVIVSPVPWAEGVKPGSLDTWDGYAQERRSIYAFLGSQGIEGVILISADRHRSDHWRIPRQKAYDLHEFESSRLSNLHTHGRMPGSLFSYNEKCSFGELEFSRDRVVYRVISIDNEEIYRFDLRFKDLR